MDGGMRITMNPRCSKLTTAGAVFLLGVVFVSVAEGVIVDAIDVVMTPLGALEAHQAVYILNETTSYDATTLASQDRTEGAWRSMFGTNGIAARAAVDDFHGADITFQVPGPGTYTIRLKGVLAPLSESRVLRLYLHDNLGEGEQIANISFADSLLHDYDVTVTLAASDLADNRFVLNVRGGGWAGGLCAGLYPGLRQQWSASGCFGVLGTQSMESAVLAELLAVRASCSDGADVAFSARRIRVVGVYGDEYVGCGGGCDILSERFGGRCGDDSGRLCPIASVGAGG